MVETAEIFQLRYSWTLSEMFLQPVNLNVIKTHQWVMTNSASRMPWVYSVQWVGSNDGVILKVWMVSFIKIHLNKILVPEMEKFSLQLHKSQTWTLNRLLFYDLIFLLGFILLILSSLPALLLDDAFSWDHFKFLLSI